MFGSNSNYKKNFEKSNPFLNLSRFVDSPFRFKFNNSNNEINEFGKFDDINSDFFKNSYLKRETPCKLLTREKREEIRDNLEQHANSRTKLKQIDSNFNNVFGTPRQQLNNFNFDPVKSSNFFNRDEEKDKLKYADDYRKCFVNDSAFKSVQGNPEKEPIFSEKKSDNNFSFKFPTSKCKNALEKHNPSSSMRNNS